MAPGRGSLQPYQGRNPCMERNLMLQAPSDEELSCNGNTLVDRSFKHSTGHYMTNATTLESQSLVSHDYLGMSQPVSNSLRPATPIPYVQNAVYDSIPKQPNIPGNGSALAEGHKGSSRWSGWGGLRKLLDSRKHLLFGMYRTHEHANRSPDIVESEDAKSNLLVRQNGIAPAAKKSPIIMETQVCLMPEKNGIITSVMSNNKTVNKDDMNKTSKNRRPSTLPLSKPNANHQSLEDHFQQMFGTSTRHLKDPNSRVKTPGDVPPSVRRMRGKANSGARFSLYDDRMMTTGDYYGPKEKPVKVEQNLSNSVPTDIDISCNVKSTASF